LQVPATVQALLAARLDRLPPEDKRLLQTAAVIGTEVPWPLLQAIALAEELGMRPLQAHCHRGLGTLYAAIGQQAHARRELSTAIELYRTMAMTFWLPQAEAALAQVEEKGGVDGRSRR
jgi:hypothetical protein